MRILFPPTPCRFCNAVRRAIVRRIPALAPVLPIVNPPPKERAK
jgi:hypothetical protein